MARVSMNAVVRRFRGSVGDLVFRRTKKGVSVMQKSDSPPAEPTARQLEQRNHFRDAVVYGKMAMADPETKAFYEAAGKEKGSPAFRTAVNDFFRPPVVQEVDLSEYGGAAGDEIVVFAEDDVTVVGVSVAVAHADGTAIEDGEAAEVPPDSGRWVYLATTDAPVGAVVHVTATALDRAGGTGEAVEEKPL